MAWDTYGCVSFSQPVVVQLLLVSNGHQRKQTEIGFCRSAWTLNIFTENANKQKRCKGRQTDFLKWHPLHCIVIRPIIGYFFLYKFVLLVKNYIIDSAGNSLSFTKIEILFQNLYMCKF